MLHLYISLKFWCDFKSVFETKFIFSIAFEQRWYCKYRLGPQEDGDPRTAGPWCTLEYAHNTLSHSLHHLLAGSLGHKLRTSQLHINFYNSLATWDIRSTGGLIPRMSPTHINITKYDHLGRCFQYLDS